MQKSLYFDTNVFDHIFKGIGISTTQIGALRNDLCGLDLKLVSSVFNVEEIFNAYRKDPVLAIEQVQLFLDLSSSKRFLAAADWLMAEYALRLMGGRPPPRPFVKHPERLESSLELLVEGDRDAIEEALQGCDEGRAQVCEFREGLKLARDRVKEVACNSAAIPSFDEFLEVQASLMAKSIASRFTRVSRLIESTSRELLLHAFPRVYIHVSLSFWYAYWGEKTEPRTSDSRDILHAALASYADSFVTIDRRLIRLLDRLHNKPYRVMDLVELTRERRY